jgi:hypothetical protein
LGLKAHQGVVNSPQLGHSCACGLPQRDTEDNRMPLIMRRQGRLVALNNLKLVRSQGGRSATEEEELKAR